MLSKLSFHLQLKLEPVIPRHNPAISVSGTKYVEKGDPIHLVCNSTGTVDPPENLDWFKDGIKLSPDGERQLKIDKFHVRTTRTLVSVLDIMHSRMDDAGTYVCRSSNLAITSTKVHVLNGLTKNVRRTSATDTVEGVGDQGSDGHGYSESRGPDGGNHASSRCQASPVVIFFLCAMTFLARLSGVRTLR
ncbi:kin of IRRE-like protein 2 [Aplysia californica]|uniref:Kin of IRRE-like protein 2 n=1 Tax=Aplysia californica TaxID=6500 RepID=A0ABM1AFZ4_APLCA|nr:kin of IRRE-like protein 2 [Aplysia californica]